MKNWFAGMTHAEWTALGLNYGIKIVGAIVLFVVGIRVARWLSSIAEHALTKADVEPTAVLFLRKVTYVVMLVVLILAVLQVFGVPMTSMVAVLGAAGLAIGLALKDSLSNIASGVMLVTLKPFKVGDMVNINGETGKVEAVSIFQTRIRGADNQVIVLPNSLITTDSIINLTPDTMRRIELVIGIGYDDDIDAAREAALAVMTCDSRVLKEPAPSVLVYELGDNSVNLGVRCYAANGDYFVTKCDLTEHIKKAFDAADISIPYPQRDVHLYQHAQAALEGNGAPRAPGREHASGLLPNTTTQPEQRG